MYCHILKTKKKKLGILIQLNLTIAFTFLYEERLSKAVKCYNRVVHLSAMYYGVSICLVSFASAMAVVTLNVHFRGLRGAEVPRSVKKVFLSGLAKIIFMNFSPNIVTQPPQTQTSGGDTFERRIRVGGGENKKHIKSVKYFSELFQVQHNKK